MPGKAARLALAVTIVLTVAATAPMTNAATPTVKRGHYMCYFYDVYGYPTLAAEIYILNEERYAGPGKKNRGSYTVGRKVAGKGHKLRFRRGAYGGWWGFYRKVNGTPYIELRNSYGEVGNGCPRS